MLADINWAALCCSPMQKDDIGTVMQIERHAYRYHWSEQNFLDCLNAPFVSMVLKSEQILLAYYVLLLVAPEAQLLNIAVAPQCWGRGIGTEMLAMAMRQSRLAYAKVMLLEVRQSNARAQRLYQSAGFENIGTRRNYYRVTEVAREDALVMQAKL